MGSRAEPQLLLGLGQRDVEHFSPARAPSIRNWSAIVVFPVPGSPSNRNMCSRVNPPARISSKPQMPLLALPTIELHQDVASQTEINSQRVQAVPSQRNLFLGGWQGCRSPAGPDATGRWGSKAARPSIGRIGPAGTPFGQQIPPAVGLGLKHCAPGAGCNHGCARRIEKCATGISHDVSSSVSARRLTASGRPSRSP